MSNEQRVTTVAPSQDVMNERWRHLTEAVDRIAAQIPLMATRAYLDEKLDDLAEKMVGRPEFDRQTWELELVKRDLERLAKETQEKIDANSPKRLWGNITTIVSGLAAIFALVVSLTGWKPH